MANWLRRRRRSQILEQGFPGGWHDLLEREVVHYRSLDDQERKRLQDFIQIFVAEKNWEGCGGMELDDEVRLLISALAGLLVLGMNHDYYSNVQSILVYPTSILTPERVPGAFEIPSGPVSSGVPILGEAQLHGPIILVWDSVKRDARHPERGHNVVYHEFAHKLDMLDGSADGTPPLGSRQAMARWVKTCQEEFSLLRSRATRGQKTLLDYYGATNEAEFFAVATETFFDKPIEMERSESNLYSLLRDFYCQDTAARARRARAS